MNHRWPDASDYAVIDAALRRALELGPTERVVAINAFNAAHPALARQLAALLEAAEPESPDTGLPVELQTALSSSFIQATARAPQRLGDWQIEACLGQGGMAEVWLAQGIGDHAGQRAALKRPLLSACTPGGLLRFERERALLAGLSDPRIARLIDSGIDADGRPWLAMEFIEGTQIDQWCDQSSAGLETRVALIAQVARAVHSAHSALVIHRDIKPSNVLINANGEVKLLDFGIGKRLALAHDTLEAPTLGIALTPQYASPEQLLGTSISTASDIWQLGRLLLQLLLGDLARDPDAHDLATLSEAARAREADAPSRRVRAADPALRTKIAAARGLKPEAWCRALRGDLDAIVQKALAAAPERRYLSAIALADDLDAWREGRAVSAQAPTWRYRLSKRLRRNPLASVAIATLLLVSALLVVTALQQSLRLRDEAQASVSVRDYLIQILQQADPLVANTPQPSTAALLDGAVNHARTQFSAQPKLLAEVLYTAANAQMRAGDYGRAQALLHEAVAFSRNPVDTRSAQILSMQGQALHYSTRYAEAEQMLRKALALQRDNDWPGRTTTVVALVDLLHSRGDYAAAARELALEPALPARSYALFKWQRQFAVIARDSGNPAAAIQLTAILNNLRLEFPGDRAAIAETELALARAELADGNFARADPLLARASPAIQKIYGSHHPVVGMLRHAQALSAELQQKPDVAIALLSEALTMDYAKTADNNVLKAYAQLDRAWNRIPIGDFAAASDDLAQAETTLLAASSGGHPRWVETQQARAILALRRNDRAAATAHLAAAMRARLAQFGPDHWLSQETARWQQALDGKPPLAVGKRLADHRLQLLLTALQTGPTNKETLSR